MDFLSNRWVSRSLWTRLVIATWALMLTAALGFGCPGFAGAEAGEEQGAGETEAVGEVGGQSRESMANDATASQWTFQFAYEYSDWRENPLSDGSPRPKGNKDMVQLRIVAPFTPEMTGLPFTILPRLTLRNIEAQSGSSGGGNAELFALVIPLEWATGRWGIGPQVNFPADNAQLGTLAWRFGFATAMLQRAMNDKLLTGLLIQQLWGESDKTRPDAVVASPISIQPVLNYALPKGYYLNIGETAFSYNWQEDAWLIPLGFRFGKLFVGKKSTWNVYAEYRRSVVYEDWPGAALGHAVRVNVSYTIPVGK